MDYVMFTYTLHGITSDFTVGHACASIAGLCFGFVLFFGANTP